MLLQQTFAQVEDSSCHSPDPAETICFAAGNGLAPACSFTQSFQIHLHSTASTLGAFVK